MKYERDARQAVATLGDAGLEAFTILQEMEDGGCVAVPELCNALENPIIQLVAFSCTTGTEDEKDLAVSTEGFFRDSVRFKTIALMEKLRVLDKEVHLTLFIDDLEWVRAWGWSSRPQSELRDEAWLQVEIAREDGRAPKADIFFWSETEPLALQRGCISYDDALKWAMQPQQSLALDADIRYRRSIPKFRHTRRSELEPSSRKRVAGYSLVGEALGILYPNAIFVQAADPRSDHLLGLRRKCPLPIIHPWR